MKPLLYARRSRPQPPPSCRQERLAWQGVHSGYGSSWGPQHLQVQRLGLGQAAGAARGGGVRARPRGQLRVSVQRWGLVSGTHGVAGVRASCGHTGSRAPPQLPQGCAQQCRRARAARPAGCRGQPQAGPAVQPGDSGRGQSWARSSCGALALGACACGCRVLPWGTWQRRPVTGVAPGACACTASGACCWRAPRCRR